MALASSNPYNNYVKQGIMTASPGELTLMLYDGVIKFIKRAKLSIEDNNIQKSNDNLKRAQDIILELINTLDLNYTVSDGLLSFYDFAYHELVEANITKDSNRLQPVIELFSDLRDTWQQAVRINRKLERGSPYTADQRNGE